MNKEKLLCIIKKLFLLPPIWIVCIAIPSFVLVFLVLGGKISNPVIEYLSYLLSAYALIIVITGFKRIVTGVRSVVPRFPFVRWLMKVPFLKKYAENPVFRTHVSLIAGLVVNLVYAGMKLLFGIRFQSVWFMVLGGYYIVLAFFKVTLLFHIYKYGIHENIRYEWKQYRFCGVILLFINLVLIVMVGMLLNDAGYFEYPGYLIYGMAMYAFYAVITTTIDLMKFRKHKSPVLSAAKVINLTAALVSMLSLEVAMVVQFGGDIAFIRRMDAMTGGGVCCITFGMSLYMILHGNRALNQNIKEGTDS